MSDSHNDSRWLGILSLEAAASSIGIPLTDLTYAAARGGLRVCLRVPPRRYYRRLRLERRETPDGPEEGFHEVGDGTLENPVALKSEDVDRVVRDRTAIVTWIGDGRDHPDDEMWALGHVWIGKPEAFRAERKVGLTDLVVLVSDLEAFAARALATETPDKPRDSPEAPVGRSRRRPPNVARLEKWRCLLAAVREVADSLRQNHVASCHSCGAYDLVGRHGEKVDAVEFERLIAAVGQSIWCAARGRPNEFMRKKRLNVSAFVRALEFTDAFSRFDGSGMSVSQLERDLPRAVALARAAADA